MPKSKRQYYTSDSEFHFSFPMVILFVLIMVSMMGAIVWQTNPGLVADLRSLATGNTTGNHTADFWDESALPRYYPRSLTQQADAQGRYVKGEKIQYVPTSGGGFTLNASCGYGTDATPSASPPSSSCPTAGFKTINDKFEAVYFRKGTKLIVIPYFKNSDNTVSLLLAPQAFLVENTISNETLMQAISNIPVRHNNKVKKLTPGFCTVSANCVNGPKIRQLKVHGINSNGEVTYDPVGSLKITKTAINIRR